MVQTGESPEVAIEIGDRCGTTEVGILGLSNGQLALAETALGKAVEEGEIPKNGQPLEVTQRKSKSGEVYTAFVFNYACFGKRRNQHGQNGAVAIKQGIQEGGEVVVNLRDSVIDLTDQPGEQNLFS